MVRDYLPEPSHAGWIGKFLTAIFILFVFILMSWTFVLIVGIIAAPFNSMLSSRIEKKLTQKVLSEDKSQTLNELFHNLKQTFKTELKKLIVIVIFAIIAFVLNLFPLFYPVGMFLVAILFAVQFIDYSWSRHNMSFAACLGDTTKNIIPYSLSGFFFLILITIPILNALVPAFATSYFTVLWLNRQKKIPQQN
jgi:CysZ protein